ncbi:hypothetical protein NC651_004673 [Populus alba x Populus x berolinensis]|nr:hypothetical protein NC651_004673 [Populus alba x Populus x berolinensis]
MARMVVTMWFLLNQRNSRIWNGSMAGVQSVVQQGLEAWKCVRQIVQHSVNVQGQGINEGAVVYCGCCSFSPTLAEALCLKNVLQFMISQGLSNVRMELDAKIVVDGINDNGIDDFEMVHSLLAVVNFLFLTIQQRNRLVFFSAVSLFWSLLSLSSPLLFSPVILVLRIGRSVY